MATAAPILVAGKWRPAESIQTFQAEDPATGEPLPAAFPVSSWADCEAALQAAEQAANLLRRTGAEPVAEFLERFADRIEARGGELCQTAHRETAYPLQPRLADVELPRTIGQLRHAAAAAREGTWQRATIDTKLNIRSRYAPLGAVCVFGPNNFPFAFGSASGGDFAAAIAAGNPVIAKANSSHPATTRLFAEEAHAAVLETGLPPATVQLLYRTRHADGQRLVADARVGATAYTGSRQAGLVLKAAADQAGKPIYLELSSINPVVVLPGAVAERGQEIAAEFTASCLMGTGQFCTNPSLVLLLSSAESERLLEQVREAFAKAPAGPLLSRSVGESLGRGLQALCDAGAEMVVGGGRLNVPGSRYANTLLRTSARRFLQNPQAVQTEVFGNASLWVLADNAEELTAVLEKLEGNLTGCIYSDTAGRDDALYELLVPSLRQRVGRLLNDKMPTGVAVSPAMNHGGPYPATGHPGFTAVGLPAAMLRFAMLECYDNVRPHRLPDILRNENPGGRAWRLIDGEWTRANVQ